MKRDEQSSFKVDNNIGDRKESMWESHLSVDDQSRNQPREQVYAESVIELNGQAKQEPQEDINEEPKQESKKEFSSQVAPESIGKVAINDYATTGGQNSRPNTYRKGAFRDMQEVKQTEFADDLKRANCCQKVLFCYPNRSIRKARENKFKITDDMILNMNTMNMDGEEESFVEIKQFWKQLERQVDLQKSRGSKDNEVDWENALLWALARHLSGGLMLFVCLAICAETLAIFYSYFIGNMIEYIQGKDQEMTTGILYVAIFGLAQYISLVIRSNYVNLGFSISIRLRRVLVAALYYKTIKLSMKSMTETSSGKLISLINGDLTAVELGMSFCPLVVAAPVINFVAYCFIASRIGVISTLIPFGCWILMIILQNFVANATKSNKMKEAKVNDERLKTVNDLVLGVRTIKCYGWEVFYEQKAREIRDRHSRFVKIQLSLQTLGSSFFQQFGLLVFLFVLLPEWFQEKKLRTADILSILSLIYFIFFQINIMTFFGISSFKTFLAVLERIASVFAMEEYTSKRERDVDPDDVMIEVKDSAFSWGFRVKEDQKGNKVRGKVLIEMDEQAIISDVNFTLRKNDHMIIVGQVGCGKTTLLHSLMEETKHMSGSLTVKGNIAYVEQEPYIYSTSIKENILFGKKLDEDLLDRALEASQLKKDIENFGKGIDTVIGERGINISGGQKARISLARAIYSEADIYLLDDPLSAVDPQVAHNIFNDCIEGFLKDKMVVLVTHQLQFLLNQTKIMVIKNGKQNLLGDFKSITQSGFDIQEILQTYMKQLSDNKIKTMFTKEVKKQLKENNMLESDQKSDKTSAAGDDEELQSPVRASDRNMLEDSPAKKSEATPSRKRENKTEGADLMVADEKEYDKVAIKDYIRLFKFSYGAWTMGLFFFQTLFCSLIQLYLSYFLTYWTNQPFEEQQKGWYPSVFAGSVVFFMLMSYTRAQIIIQILSKASKNIHDAMLTHVARSRILFFDSNPVGRILARFSKDVSVVDLQIPALSNFAAQGVFRTISVFCILMVIQPFLMIPVFVAACLMYIVFQRVIDVANAAQRQDSVYRGPLGTNFTNAVSGLVTLRTFERLPFFERIFIDDLNKSCNATFTMFAIQRHMIIQLDCICILVTISAAAFALLQSKNGDPDSDDYKRQQEQLAFSLQILTDVVSFFAISIRFMGQIDNMMTSSQRLMDYTDLELEDDVLKVTDKPHQEQNWPQKGEIKFEEASMKYREGLEPSIEQLTFTVQPNMKVGIVGRTGAGKSSILQALFRLCELHEGRIVIDGVDIKTLGLHLLRKNIAYIPQSPFLLQGTIRQNLDPFDALPDEQIDQILKDVKLYDHVESLQDKKQTIVTESNNLFSVGQKQLICMARAILQKTKILVLDEATANVDLETDNLIQQKLRTSFESSTVILIAHRLATVIDADRILVMDKGRGEEFDHPFKLLCNDPENDTEITNKDGLLSKMVMATGKETAESLFNIAKQKYKGQQ